jgi:hypothetical protein
MSLIGVPSAASGKSLIDKGFRSFRISRADSLAGVSGVFSRQGAARINPCLEASYGTVTEARE